MHTPLYIASKKTPRLALGTWALGGGADWGELPITQAQEVLVAAIEAGIGWIDSSPVYGWGEAETRLGQVIGPFRERLILASKCGICLNGQNRPDHDLSPQRIVAECEASLRRLQTDYLDLYQIHWPDPKVALEDSLATLQRLKEQGKIKAIGVCNFLVELLQKACQITSIECVQNQLSLLAVLPREILDFCKKRQISFLGYGLLGGGILSGKYQKEPNFRRCDARKYFYPYYTGECFVQAQETVKRVKELSSQKNISAAALSLAWGLAQTGVSGVLFGARSPEQLRQNIQALEVELSAEEKEFLQHG